MGQLVNRYKTVQVGNITDVRDTQENEYISLANPLEARVISESLNLGILSRVGMNWKSMGGES